MLTYNTYDLAACMAANDLSCEASDTVINLAALIPQELALKIIAASRLYLACNPATGGVTIVDVPATSASPGAIGQEANDADFHYWYNGTEWRRSLGEEF